MTTSCNHATSGIEHFLNQLMLPQQLTLFEYWKSLRPTNGDWPRWRDFRLTELRRLAANLLLIEPRPWPEGMHVRLAGSGLWDIHGREITGLTLAHAHWNQRDGYWRRVHERMLQQPQPDSGHFNDPERGVVIFWMRLPVRGDDGAIWLLGLDIAVPMSRVTSMESPRQWEQQSQTTEEAPHDPPLSLLPPVAAATSVRIRLRPAALARIA